MTAYMKKYIVVIGVQCIFQTAQPFMLLEYVVIFIFFFFLEICGVVRVKSSIIYGHFLLKS